MVMGMSEASEQQRRADNLKDKGNLYFKKEKLNAAIEAYTEAITLCPRVPVYWTNRALCERKRNEWEKVENDCRRALELDSRSFKAYYMLGLALLQYQQYEEAVKQLEKALDLSRGAMHSHYMVEEIWQELAKAKLAEWEAVVDVRTQRQQDLQTYLARLLREDYEKQLKEAFAHIKATAGGGDGNTKQGGLLTQSAEVGDLIRFDSDDKANSLDRDKSSKMAQVQPAQFSRMYSDLYRTYSEPVKLDSISNQGDDRKGGEVFDPLKQHKLSIRRSRSRSRSASIQRQRSQPVSSDDIANHQSLKPAPWQKMDQSPRPGDTGTTASTGATENSQARTSPPNGAEVPATDAAVSTSKSTGESEATDIRSIYDVYKVFKEFMKLRQNEAGQMLLKLSEAYQRRSQVMDDVFKRVAKPDVVGEVPDHLCCKITMDIFRDPVITPSGITYERAAITDHIRKIGKFDPFTRAALTEDQIFPNLALKEAVQMFLNEYGWAYGS